MSRPNYQRFEPVTNILMLVQFCLSNDEWASSSQIMSIFQTFQTKLHLGSIDWQLLFYPECKLWYPPSSKAIVFSRSLERSINSELGNQPYHASQCSHSYYLTRCGKQTDRVSHAWRLGTVETCVRRTMYNLILYVIDITPYHGFAFSVGKHKRLLYLRAYFFDANSETLKYFFFKHTL